MSNSLKLFFKSVFAAVVVSLLAILILPIWIEVNTDFLIKLVISLLGVSLLVSILVLFGSKDK